MTALEQLIKEVREAKENATPGSWNDGYTNAGRVTKIDDHVWGGESQKEPICDVSQQKDIDFICTAANKIELLLEIIEWQNEALKDVLWQAEYGEIGSCGESVRSVLVEIEALIKEEK